MRHALVDGRFACLSYVWGETDAGDWIFLNGQRFWTRNNLLAFLEYARQKAHHCQEWLWIDALCIDQANSAERTHQVQQMGRIFGSAYNVISWLGSEKTIAKYLKQLADPPEAEEYLRYTGELYSAVYWDRAWITQELALARRNTFIAAGTEVNRIITLPPWRVRGMHPHTRAERIEIENTYDLRGRSLIYLLDIFKSKLCSIPRDRIFSLLALCGDGARVTVDYDNTHRDLARDVLRTCYESFCFCSIRILQYVLRPELSMEPGTDTSLVEQPLAQITLPIIAQNMPGWWLTPSLAYASTRDSIGNIVEEVTLDLRHLCSRSSGHITFSTSLSNQGVMYRCTGKKSNDHDPVCYRTHGCTIEVCQDAKSCTISFSLDLLLEIAMIFNQGSEPICCHRVADCGTDFAEPTTKRVLRLCKG